MMKKRALTREHEGVLKYFLIGVAAFNIADYLLTTLALQFGYREINPLMDLIIHTPFFPILKIVLIPLMLYSIWRKREFIGQRILFYVGFLFLVYFFLMVYFKLQLWMWAMRGLI